MHEQDCTICSRHTHTTAESMRGHAQQAWPLSPQIHACTSKTVQFVHDTHTQPRSQ